MLIASAICRNWCSTPTSQPSRRSQSLRSQYRGLELSSEGREQGAAVLVGRATGLAPNLPAATAAVTQHGTGVKQPQAYLYQKAEVGAGGLVCLPSFFQESLPTQTKSWLLFRGEASPELRALFQNSNKPEDHVLLYTRFC